MRVLGVCAILKCVESVRQVRIVGTPPKWAYWSGNFKLLKCCDSLLGISREEQVNG